MLNSKWNKIYWHDLLQYNTSKRGRSETFSFHFLLSLVDLQILIEVILLKYRICKKLLLYKWTSEQLNIFSSKLDWGLCANLILMKKVFNYSEVHSWRSNFFKNKYFSLSKPFSCLLLIFLSPLAHFSENFLCCSNRTI